MARTVVYRTFAVGAVIVGLGWCLGRPAIAQQCPGDCNQSGSTEVTELMLGVQILTGEAPVASCPSFDGDGNGTVSVDELTSAIGAALDGCAAPDAIAPRAVGTVTLVVGTAVIAVGDSGSFDVSLDSGGLDVAGIQIDITYDPSTPIADVGGSPDCVVNPATGKDLFKAFLPGDRARFLVLSLSDVNTIPDGVLFTCNVDVSLFASPGTYPLTGSNEGASDPDGNALTTVSTPGAVIVLPPVPTSTATPTPTLPPPLTPTPTVCAPIPLTGCRTAAKSSFSLRDDTLTWRWLNGTSSLGDFGYPVAGPTTYAICIYGRQDGVASLAMRARVAGSSMCGGTFCWRPTGLRGFKYKDAAGTSDGITRIRLKTGSGDAKILVKGKGAALPVPPPADPNNLIYQDPSVTVQLRNSDGICWEAVYPGPAQRINGRQFVDRF